MKYHNTGDKREASRKKIQVPYEESGALQSSQPSNWKDVNNRAISSKLQRKITSNLEFSTQSNHLMKSRIKVFSDMKRSQNLPCILSQETIGEYIPSKKEPIFNLKKST